LKKSQRPKPEGNSQNLDLEEKISRENSKKRKHQDISNSIETSEIKLQEKRRKITSLLESMSKETLKDQKKSENFKQNSSK